ncbi:putative nonribosomal peptide synthase [Aspergillus karnatakaensis]|uniref:putative nonribosomal peptide synthase n=1 Tax=Aspergillus karnatakaensis TaxID=1810916 RepID=UPI003CCCE544
MQNTETSEEFWTRELRDFSSVPDRQFPALTCERVQVTPETATTVSQRVVLSITRKELESTAGLLQIQSSASIVRAAFAYTIAEYLENDKVILGEVCPSTAETAQNNQLMLIPLAFSAGITTVDLVLKVDGSVSNASRLKTSSQDLLQQALQCLPSQAPYNALFSYSNAPFSPGGTSSRAGIALYLSHEQDDSLSCTLSAREDLLDCAHLSILLHQVTTLITAMTTHPSESVRSLAQYFPPSLLSSHTPTVSPSLKQAPSLTPYHWVDHHAAQNPTWPAVEIITSIIETQTVTKTYTYAELAETSNRICTYLVQKGWRNQVIAVCLSRSFTAYAIVLGIWKSGNCYVPIAEDLPEARRVFLLGDSNAVVLFTEEIPDTESLTPPDGCEVIDVNDTSFQDELRSIDTSSQITANPADNCYLLYTSGSTGTPKGVLVSRGNLSSFTEAQSEFITQHVPDTATLGGKGSYLAHASRAFDVHICEMVLAWRHGLRLVTGPRTVILDNLRLVLTRCRISHAGFVPSLLEHTGLSASDLPDLRYLGVGGEKISETIIERFVDKPPIALVNAYGPTEVTIGMTSHAVTGKSTVRNIGTAVGNITVYVLDPEGDMLVKRGLAGELCVTGDLVASGYHNRPEAKGFVEFCGQRMYRTGDIVRLMAGDCVEYLGRRDSQAKVRGQRLELEEVSVAVKRFVRADVEVNVTSMVTPSPVTKRPQLVTFIAVSGERREDATGKPVFRKELYREWVPGILERCREELPVYMVPSALLPVSFIPVQISGKADNRRLVALYESIPPGELLLDALVVSMSAAAERSELLTGDEQRLLEIMSSVVSVDRSTVKSSTSIFQLGIDSLGALSLASKIRDAGYACTAADVLGNTTLGQLAALLQSQQENHLAEGEDTAEASRLLDCLDRAFRGRDKAISNSVIATVLPCLPLQESLVSSSLGSPVPLYVNHIVLRLGSHVLLDRLKTAFQDLIDETDILRTCFALMDDQVVQVVLKPRAAKVNWEQLSAQGDKEACEHFANIQDRIAGDIVQNIERQPPLRISAVFSNADNAADWLMLSVNHSIFDGASMALFIERLWRHYTGKASLHVIDHRPLYRRFITAPTQDAERFWSSYLANCTPTIVSTRSTASTSYEIFTKELPWKLSAITAHASTLSTTAPMLLEKLFAIALAKHLNQADIVFGRVMNGRSIPVPDIENMLVPLVTTIPGRLQLPPTPSSLVALVKGYTESALKALLYQHTALRDIRRFADISEQLFDCLFSYLAVGAPSPADGFLVEIESVMAADYPLALEVSANQRNDTMTLRMRVEGGGDVVEAGRGIIETMVSLLEGLFESGDIVLDGVSAETPQVQAVANSPWDEEQWSEGERSIRKLLAEITALPQSSITKNVSFFALGIDSVVAIRLARRLQKQGMKVTSADIMRYPSIGALYACVKARGVISKSALPRQVDVHQTNGTSSTNTEDTISDTYPCTPLQTAMIGECLASGGKGYVHHHVVVLDDSVNLERLTNAWQGITERADILRTSFQRNSPGRSIEARVHKFAVVQWSHQAGIILLPEAIEEISQRVIYSDLNSFQKPPWQVTLLSGLTQRLLVLTMHHCLYDGFSLPLLFDSVERIYRSEECRVGYFASIARSIAHTEEESVRFWADSVKGYRHRGLPTPTPLENGQSVHWAEVKLQTPVATLQRHCGSLEVTLQTVALLAFGRSLAHLLGQRDVVFGHVVSERGQYDDGIAPAIGPLLNTVACRVRLDSVVEKTSSVVKRMQKFYAESLSFQHAPLGLVQKSWRAESESSQSDLIDALLTFNRSEEIRSGSMFQPYVADRKPDVPHYRLNVEFEQTPETLVARASCRDLLTQDELDEWLQSLTLGIEDILFSPDEPVLSFPAGICDLPLLAENAQGVVEEAMVTDSIAEITEINIIKGAISQVTQLPAEKLYGRSNIFALGIDSILAIDISTRCREAGLDCSVSDILRGTTIPGIAALVTKKSSINGVSVHTNGHMKQNGVTETRPSVSEIGMEAILPCLSGQLFYISSWLRSDRRLGEYTFAFKGNSDKRLDPERLGQVWAALQERHSILRTSFAAKSPTEIVQVVHKPSAPKKALRVENRQSAQDPQVSLQEVVSSITATPSDLFTPPVRLCLVQQSNHDALLLTLHHALYDAWTIPLLLEDLQALYLSTPLPPASSFTPFVHYHQEHSNNGETRKYWSSALQNHQPTLLGTDVMEPESHPVFHSSIVTSPHSLRSLEIACRRAGVSLSSFILLAIARSLAQSTNVSNPVFGLFTSGRSSDYPDIRSVVGPTVNMLPLVIRDALASPSVKALSAIQCDMTERALHDQSYLEDLLPGIKERGNELMFNVLVNIVLGAPKSSATVKAKDIETFLTPVLLPDTLDASFNILSEFTHGVGTTSVNKWDPAWLPCERNIYLEVSVVETEAGIENETATDNALRWRLDYTTDTLSPDLAQGILRGFEEEARHLLGALQ